MPFTPKDWEDSPSTATPLSAAALEDLENRLSVWERKRGLWNPAPSMPIDETIPIRLANIAGATTSGTMRVFGGLMIPANTQVTKIGTAAASGIVTPTNQWFALIATDNTVIRKTSDDTTTAWAGSSFKELTLSSPYTPSVDEAVYVGIVTVAATAVQLPTITTLGWQNAAPKLAFNANAGLTDPASLGASITPGANSTWGYAYIA